MVSEVYKIAMTYRDKEGKVVYLQVYKKSSSDEAVYVYKQEDTKDKTSKNTPKPKAVAVKAKSID